MSSAQRILDRLVTQREGPRDRPAHLEERQYVVPDGGAYRMFDFYALYALWWSVGSGKAAYGYTAHAPDAILPHKLAARVERTFEECVTTLAYDMVRVVQSAIYDEMTNLEDEFVIRPRDFLNWLAPQGGSAAPFRSMVRTNPHYDPSDPDSLPAEIRLPDERKFWADIGYDGAERLFSAPFWQTEYSDAYGGANWARITRLGRDLLGLTKARDPKLQNLVSAIDHLYDAHHNTGGLLNKSATGILRVSQASLDARARARTPADFLYRVSEPVQQLIRAVLARQGHDTSARQQEALRAALEEARAAGAEG